MSVLALMYHRAQAGRHGNSPEMLDAHFAYIVGNYACVLPGESRTSEALNVCLTFDDAYFDFYHVVFPLLKKHGLRAVLAVPPVAIRERAEASVSARLEAPACVDYHQPNYDGFCTWSELQEMAATDHVAIAAHGFTHCPLDQADTDFQTEIELPKNLLHGRLGQRVDSFVFPYGRFSPAALQHVHRHYRHAFRIGGADNGGWDRLLYRVDADGMAAPDAPFSGVRRAKYRARRFWNRARDR
jgi:peptidoglycan/xylan/chitin deacetylase (PgdA/CDA1 family)